MWNPIRTVMRSNSLRGIKIIALSLMLVLLSAAPVMLCSIVDPDGDAPLWTGWLFAAGAVLAHLGFLVGIVLVMWDMYFAKK